LRQRRDPAGALPAERTRMTALQVTPAGFGYPPAREARLASEQAFERGIATSCTMVAALFAICFLLRGFLPAAPTAIDAVREPVVIGDFVQKSWRRPPGPSVPQARPEGGVPLPVPDATVHEAVQQAPPLAGTDGETHPGVPIGVPGGDVGRNPGLQATPEPGEWIPTEQLPDLVLQVKPEYPDLAREAQVEGTVHLWALVDLDGSVREVRVRKSVPLLDGAAVSAVARWRFTPALDNGRPVRVWVAVPVRFTLH
jgi:TonB family protein